MTVTLKPDLEEEVTARAQAEGLTTEEFVNRELEKLIASAPAEPKLTPQERAKLWRDWIDKHSVGGPSLSDYAVSRESIYKGAKTRNYDLSGRYECSAAKHSDRSSDARRCKSSSRIVNRPAHILTFNTDDFKRYDEITVVNPQNVI